MSVKKTKKKNKKKLFKEIKKKLKGFTLVELLAVIVILGIIMIISIPTVLNSIEAAQSKSFVEYMTKVYEAAEKEYLGNQSLNNSIETCLIYNIDTDLELPPNKSYHGYVLVSKEGDGTEYYVTLWNEDYMVGKVNYRDIDQSELKAFTKEDDEYISTDYLSQNCGEYYEVESSDIIVPEIIEKPKYKSFYNDSWKTINRKVKSGYYDYEVGDVKCVKLNVFNSTTTSIKDPQTGEELKNCTDGEYLIRIVNTSQCSDAELSESSCGFIIEFAEAITSYKFETNNSNKKKYIDSYLRSYLVSTIYNSLPDDLKTYMAHPQVLTERGRADREYYGDTYDTLFLLSLKEILGPVDASKDPSEAFTKQLDYYLMNGVTKDSNNNVSKKKINNNYATYWTRSSDFSKNNGAYLAIDSNGQSGGHNSNKEYGVAPAFKIANQSGK